VSCCGAACGLPASDVPYRFAVYIAGWVGCDTTSDRQCRWHCDRRRYRRCSCWIQLVQLLMPIADASRSFAIHGRFVRQRLARQFVLLDPPGAVADGHLLLLLLLLLFQTTSSSQEQALRFSPCLIDQILLTALLRVAQSHALRVCDGGAAP